MNLRHLLTTRYIVIGVLLAFIVFEGIVYFQISFKNLDIPGKTSNQTLEQYAEKIVASCSLVNYRPACYDKEIPSLMHDISMEDAFKVTRLVQSKDTSYPYCHVLAHELSAREVDKNPNKWKEVVTRCPAGMCSNGCIHGGFQEKFRAEFMTDSQVEAIKPELSDLCEQRGNWTPTGLEQASCYHALGHLTMYVTNAQITKALVLCDELAIKSPARDFSHLCYDGAFMQIFQPLEPEDFALIKGKEVTKPQHIVFCNKFTGAQKGSCWSEGWPLYRAELEKPQGLTAYCNKASATERDRCFEAVLYVVTTIFNLDSSKVLAYCPGLEQSRQGGCFASAASRMIEVDYRNIKKASELCSTASKYDPEHKCFARLLQYSTYNYKPGTSEFYQVCDALPDSWKDKCIKRI